MAQLVTANPKLFSKSTDQELSESVVKVSGNSKFTRLDVRKAEVIPSPSNWLIRSAVAILG